MTYDWVVLDEDWESSGPDISTAIDCLDDGDEVTVLFFRQIDRRYRFETVDGVPTLVDTDLATRMAALNAGAIDFLTKPIDPPRLQAGCRKVGVEVMYTVIRNLTADGRDRSLDYKITGFNVPPDSFDGQVLDAIRPGPDPRPS